eukprot:CAMPEP_0204267432 /NCGR_PEP_ID=MMETSP0468-20130131/10950_1 /ASSEMBLY_ACC=CAM_ASM_000383 /TAXON_ID=2969 /ORGANISM="Oxyrrhis marina" /LENGTH=595 /DNA_ID=CAMNT_0051242601 /DNA_START=29 /DNA_END=1816 /DNA_ORIENTATION=-
MAAVHSGEDSPLASAILFGTGAAEFGIFDDDEPLAASILRDSALDLEDALAPRPAQRSTPASPPRHGQPPRQSPPPAPAPAKNYHTPNPASGGWGMSPTPSPATDFLRFMTESSKLTPGPTRSWHESPAMYPWTPPAFHEMAVALANVAWQAKASPNSNAGWSPSAPEGPRMPSLPSPGSERQYGKGGKKGGHEWPSPGMGKGSSKGAGYKSGENSEANQTYPSPLVQEFRKVKDLRLTHLVKDLLDLALDQHGSRLIQEKLETGTVAEKDAALEQLLPDAAKLAMHMFGNYVVQKFLESGEAHQRRALAATFVGHIQRFAEDMYGCRVLQKTLECIELDQKILLSRELDGNVVRIVEHQHGNHVIQKCIDTMPAADIDFIVQAMYNGLTKMARQSYGCRVLQQLIEKCPPEQVGKIMDGIVEQFEDLARDSFGNFVVQHVLKHSPRPEDRRRILDGIMANIVVLSSHKFASNVIEHAVRHCTQEERRELVKLVLAEGDTGAPLLTMMCDKYANFVVQKMLELVDGKEREDLLAALRDQLPVLRKFQFGKYIASTLDRYEGGDKVREGREFHRNRKAQAAGPEFKAPPGLVEESS